MTLTRHAPTTQAIFVQVAPLASQAELIRPPWDWWSPPDRALNILIFMPLGFFVVFVRQQSVRRWLIVAALAMPLFVESVQWTVQWLRRDPQWQDVVDNTIGVMLGLALGILVQRLNAWRVGRDSSR